MYGGAFDSRLVNDPSEQGRSSQPMTQTATGLVLTFFY